MRWEIYYIVDTKVVWMQNLHLEYLHTRITAPFNFFSNVISNVYFYYQLQVFLR